MASTLDRRRANGPPGGTSAPVYYFPPGAESGKAGDIPDARKPNQIRKIFLKTGLVPSASGSAYLELERSAGSQLAATHHFPSPSLKLTCSVHGPKPLARSAAFSPNMAISAYVKFAPFATRRRGGHQRGPQERDLAVHLESALRGAVLCDRWPKSGLEVVITVLEAEEEEVGLNVGADPARRAKAGAAGMTVLGGCITVASAALINAGIDCVDIVSGGVAALVPVKSSGKGKTKKGEAEYEVVQDPEFYRYDDVVATCVVGYMPSRDELTDLWINGSIPTSGSQDGLDALIEGAVLAATASSLVVSDCAEDQN